MAHTEHTSMKPSRGQPVQTPKYQDHDTSFGSNIFNTSTLVNAGLNLATAGGLVIWVNSKFSSYEEKIDKLVQIIAEQKERIDTHEKFIVKHEQIFRGEIPSNPGEISNDNRSSNTQSQSSQQIQNDTLLSHDQQPPKRKLPRKKGKKPSKKIGSTTTTTSTTIPSSKTLEVDTVQKDEQEEDEIDKAIEHFAADEIESVVSSSKIPSEALNCEGDVCVIGDDGLKKS